MAFTIYRSTDGSAPVLTGENGKLVDLLDAVLVNGYGSKAAAGWAKSFSGTSKAAYRAPAGSQMYLRVQDDGPGAGGAREARLTGYVTMSDVDTGTGPFPTAAQGVGGVAMLVARKSASADTTARAWIIFADARTMYVFLIPGDAAGGLRAFMFGEFYALLSSDAYRTMLIGRTAENTAGGSSDTLDVITTGVSSSVAGHFAARGYTGLGGSIATGVHGDAAKNGNSSLINGVVPMPNPPDGGLYLSPVWVHDSTTSPANHVRGRMRGFWQLLHPPGSVGDQETFVGTGELSGKTFMFLKTSGQSQAYTMEISDTLETN